jgi:hypothetical protein
MEKETQQATDTHFLERPDGVTSQNGNRNTKSNGNSLSGETRWTNKSEWQRKYSKQWALAN